MPAWITLTADSLNAYLVAAQMTALRTKALAAGQGDPFAEIAPDVILKVRAYIASNSSNQVDAAPLTIPPELRIDTIYLIVAPMLGRLGIALTDDQQKQVEIAHSTLIALRDGKLLVTKPDQPITPDVTGAAGAAEIVGGGKRTITRDSLAGL